MSIFFPDNWANLRYPNIRSDLLLFLEELSDVEYQSNYVISSNTAHDKFDIDEIYHFFFDDTDLVINAEGCIGQILFDIDEVKLVSEVTEILKKILEDLGDSGNDEYTSHPYWRNVVDKASLALRKLSEAGTPLITQ